MKKKEENVRRIPKALIDKDWKGSTGIIVPILNEAVILFVGDDDDLLKYHEKSRNTITLNIDAMVRTDDTNWKRSLGRTISYEGTSLIQIPRIDLSDINCMDSLYHEALHVALLTIKRTGVEIGNYGEILAYLQGYIVKSLINNLEEGKYGTLLEDGTRIDDRTVSKDDISEIRRLLKESKAASINGK